MRGFSGRSNSSITNICISLITCDLPRGVSFIKLVYLDYQEVLSGHVLFLQNVVETHILHAFGDS